MKPSFYFSKRMLLLLLALFPFILFSQNPYITVWKTDNPGLSANNQIIFPASGSYTYTWFEVGNESNTESGSGTDEMTFDFPYPGTYQLEIVPSGTVPFHKFTLDGFNHPGIHGIMIYEDDSEKIIDLKSWGDVNWSSFEKAYYQASNLSITAIDIPDLSLVENMSRAFTGTSLIGGIPGINNWDVSNVTNMSGTFSGANYFNSPLSNWDVSNVTDMSFMFSSCSAFNQPINSWNVGNVTNMRGMFMSTDFDQFIGSWNVSKVTNMSYMFSGTFYFDQPLNTWNVSNVTDMSNMFSLARSFNKPLNFWNTANVTDMSFMFSNAEKFNSSIENWNTLNVTNMKAMFGEAYNFNQPIGSWKVGNVTDMSYMFNSTNMFNQFIGYWDVSHVENMEFMFTYSNLFNQDLSEWDVSNVKNFLFIFDNANSFNQSLGTWKLNSVDNGFAPRFSSTAVDCENYSKTIMGWANNPLIQPSLSFYNSEKTYSPDVIQERDYLINEKNWTIGGDSEGDCTILSTNEAISVEFQIYPNPATNQFHIDGLKGNETIDILDSSGKLLQSTKVTTNLMSFNIQSLTPGIYRLIITDKSGRKTLKSLLKK